MSVYTKEMIFGSQKKKFTGKIKKETVKKYKKHFKTNDDFNELVSKLLEEYFEKMA